MMGHRPLGWDHGEDPGLRWPERTYIRLFGYPAIGMRIRAKGVLPLFERLGTPRRVLDAGCGKGVFSLAMARRFPAAQVTAVDMTESLIERNRKLIATLGVPNLEFRVADVTQLQDAQGFDAILATDILEHVDEDQALLQTFHDNLASGGTLILHVPHVTRHVWGWSRQNFMGIEGHVRPGYTMEGLRGMLEKSGFRVEDAFYNYNNVETLVNDISYLVTGGRERNKALYALVFPWLLLGSWLAGTRRPSRGSGLIYLARRA